MVGDGEKTTACPQCSAAVPAGVPICPNCGAAVRDVSQTLTSGLTSVLTDTDWDRFAPGNVFANRYTIIEEIGHGGMGRVLKAIDRSLGITVAIKIIRSEYASNPRVVELFKQEIVRARSISSENVIRVHDLGEAEGTRYISMDFVEGQNLRDLIYASGSLTISTAVKFGQQICSGLAAAHKQGIMHRDLKPSNIMIDKTGRVRVMDFGLAKTIDREEAEGVRAIVGTPEYLSPEQARGEKLDQRTDIYAFGLILYEMVTGRPVFEAESLTGYIQKHCEVTPEPPSRWNHLIPAALDGIILKCLKKNRNERYQKVEDVCQALDRVVAPEAHKPKPARSRLLRILAGAAACALLGIIAYFFFFPRPRPPVPSIHKSIAVMTPENVTGDSSQDRLGGMIRYLLQLDLEQSRLLRVVPRERLLDCIKKFHLSDAGGYAQADLDKIAASENVDFFILGGYLKSGEGCRIDVHILDARLRDTVAYQSFDAAVLDEIQDSCDQISLWAKQQFELSSRDLAKDFDKELKNYPTRSKEALLYFLQGLDFYEKRDFPHSIDCYRKAVDIDKKFALAYARLATDYSYQGQHEEAKKYLLKARSLQRNLTLRERLLIDGDYYNAYECNYAMAIQTFKDLLIAYPEDEMALENLGAIYRNTERWEEAKACFEHLQGVNPHSRIAVLNLFQIAEAMGQYEKAAGLLLSNRDVLTVPDEFSQLLAACYFHQGRTDQALLELEKAFSSASSEANVPPLLGHIQTVLGNFPEAEAAYRRLLAEDRPSLIKFSGHFWLGHLYLLQGQYGNCAREIEEGLKLTRSQGFLYEESLFLLFESYLFYLQRNFAGTYEAALQARKKAAEIPYPEAEIEALYWQGLSDVGRGQIPEARRTIGTIKQMVDKIGYPKLLRTCYQLEGIIAAVRNSWDEAVDDFRKVEETLPHQFQEGDPSALYIESLASALLQRGDQDSARAKYEEIISMTSGRLTAGDSYVRSLYELGKICQEKRELEKAREYFRSFLNVLRNADIKPPQVEDARRRLGAVS
jgi:tetratricopeptide (TPR) repeat protein